MLRVRQPARVGPQVDPSFLSRKDQARSRGKHQGLYAREDAHEDGQSRNHHRTRHRSTHPRVHLAVAVRYPDAGRMAHYSEVVDSEQLRFWHLCLPSYPFPFSFLPFPTTFVSPPASVSLPGP